MPVEQETKDDPAKGFTKVQVQYGGEIFSDGSKRDHDVLTFLVQEVRAHGDLPRLLHRL